MDAQAGHGGGSKPAGSSSKCSGQRLTTAEHRPAKDGLAIEPQWQVY